MTQADHTKEPWRWASAVEGTMQLEGNIEYEDMNPVLIARGCDKGCFPNGLGGDPNQVCPLLPTKADRDRITACVNACAGLNPEAIQRLVESCDKLKDALRNHAAEKDNILSDYGYSVRKEFHTALAAVKEVPSEATRNESR